MTQELFERVGGILGPHIQNAHAWLKKEHGPKVAETFMMTLEAGGALSAGKIVQSAKAAVALSGKAWHYEPRIKAPNETAAAPPAAGQTARPQPAGHPEPAGASALNAKLLKKQLIAEQISKGHSFEKHVLRQGEFPSWIRTKKQLQDHIEIVLNDPITTQKTIDNIRTVYVHRPSHTVIIHNDKAVDRGTVFQPKVGIDEFLQSRGWK